MSLFGAPRAQFNFYTKFENMDRGLQLKLKPLLTQLASHMRQCHRYNQTKGPKEISQPEILPDRAAAKIMDICEMYGYLRIQWGRQLFESFVKWEQASLARKENSTSNGANSVRKEVTHQGCSVYRKEGESAKSYNQRAGLCNTWKCKRCGLGIQGKGFYKNHTRAQRCTALPRASKRSKIEYSAGGVEWATQIQKGSGSGSATMECTFCIVAYPLQKCYKYKGSNADHCAHITGSLHLVHPTIDMELCSGCDKYIKTNVRHRCSGGGDANEVPEDTKWVCFICQMQKAVHIFDTAYELSMHDSQYHPNT